MDLHREVCPEKMKALHERMEELLQQYLSKYGSNPYDPNPYLDVDLNEKRKRRLSSSRRREVIRNRPSSGSFERAQTVSGNSPIMERKM